MDEQQIDDLFARYVEHFVVNGSHLDLEELAAGDPAAASALRARVDAFQRIDEALGSELQSLSGRTLGRYEVRERLGAGGMGEVYRAVDLDLGREVALKVLPPLLAWDPQRRARFEREARILATLDHRNIGAIYGLERADGLLFLELELVAGDTLAERIGRGPLALDEALSLMCQLASALAAAHAKGVVHRDLKPANVKVTPDGIVKLLDFGLGKSPDGPEPECAHTDRVEREIQPIARGFDRTATGLVFGTAGYMSPEQSRGEPADARSDIFSFGVICQELLTGTNPFTRGTWAETRAAITGEQAPLLSVSRPDIDAHRLTSLQGVLDRCLAKEPGDRYQRTADLLADLEALASSDEVAAATPGTGRKWLLLAAVSAGSVLLATALAYRATQPEHVPALSNPVMVTRGMGAEEYPSWSPDGSRLAYGLNTKGHETTYDIWVTSVNGGEAVNLTADHPGMDRYPVWSPDGSQIAFWSQREGGGYFVMPARPGAVARKVLGPSTPSSPSSFWATRPQWSPDGRELAMVAMDAGRASLLARSFESGRSRLLPLPGRRRMRRDPSWSPDGRYVAYVDGDVSEIQEVELRVLRLADREAFSVVGGVVGVRGPSWSPDGQSLWFTASRGGSTDLWRQKLEDGRPTGPPERVTAGIGMTTASLSRDGRRLAYSRGRQVSNVWRVPILRERPATWVDAEQITFDEALIRNLAASPNGRQLVVASDRSGNWDLWMLPAAGGELQRATSDPAADMTAAWSPDGKHLAFISNRSGSSHVWVQQVGGEPARQLTTGNGDRTNPAWSPDGQRLLFTWRQAGQSDLWVIPAAGGEPRRIAPHPQDEGRARWSPNGRWLVFYSTRLGKEALWRASADGRNPELLVERAYSVDWSADGSCVYYIGVGAPAANVWAVTIDGRARRPLTDLRGRRGMIGSNHHALAASSSHLYFVWQEDLGDIWVADLVPSG